MARNLLAETTTTAPFAHFRSGPGMAIHSDELRPVFDSLTADDQEWIAEVIGRHDRTDYETVAEKLGLQESVTVGLIAMLHPEA
jgi:hypothetical protein